MMMTEKKNVQCTWQERVIDLLDFLKQEGLSPDLLDGIREFNAQYPTPPELQNRIPQPRYHYYGKDVSEALKKQHIDIDKRKITIQGEVTGTGVYEAVIKVHPTVTSKIKVSVVAE